MGDMVSSGAERIRSAASSSAAEPRVSCPPGAGAAASPCGRCAPERLSSSRYSRARETTCSGTPASLATSMP